ncbi:energy transducer TonB [Sabulilitoribacter arenilitoris]|uniref:Energy transducer TonB n=1 Tax=Wocania arenilitoris TaxID=2044858 RepID=A0AAE3EMZ8_9FLAO|nr:energy transducer TonB [Wocania arenilitoris]
MKKPQKHDANLQKNSTLYFQIGLIVCLLTTYGLFEMKFETTIHDYGDLPPVDPPTYIDVPIIITLKPVVDEPVKQKQKEQSNKFEEVPNDTPDLPFENEPEKPSDDVNPPIDPGDIEVTPVPEDVPVPIAFIQNAPIYPGCEKAKNNDERKRCMSKKITNLIQRKFQGDDIASEYGLTGVQKIDVQFTIDKTGKVNNIKTRAPHPKLEGEVIRVINLMPEMTPGKQNDKNVDVIYTLPIKFKVQ